MVYIAVTGGIGCGKSHLALYLQSCFIPVCEADELAHKALSHGTKVYADVVSEFGMAILDDSGEVNRNKLAAIVFGCETKLNRLNALVHPFVKKEIINWLKSEEEKGASAAAVIIPLLFEVGMESGWDAIIAIGCSDETQNERLMKRGLSENQCRQRIASQMPVKDKMDKAEFAIWNDEDKKSFEKKIDDVLKMILEKKHGRRE